MQPTPYLTGSRSIKLYNFSAFLTFVVPSLESGFGGLGDVAASAVQDGILLSGVFGEFAEFPATELNEFLLICLLDVVLCLQVVSQLEAEHLPGKL